MLKYVYNYVTTYIVVLVDGQITKNQKFLDKPPHC